MFKYDYFSIFVEFGGGPFLDFFSGGIEQRVKKVGFIIYPF
jgi:hypothetical protein